MSKLEESPGYRIIESWMLSQGKQPFSFQKKVWEKLNRGYSGMVVAPTGFGKTFSVFLGLLVNFMNAPERYGKGLKMIWVAPLRSLSTDLARAMQDAIEQIGLDWSVEARNGDTDVKIKQRQSKQMPDILLVTPESLHLLIAQKGRDRFFRSLRVVVVDEWHELLSTKRGVMVELALAYFYHFCKRPSVWGITATIGNLGEAMDVLLPQDSKKVKIIAKEKKLFEIVSVFPEQVEVLPWAGHLGKSLVEQVVPIILQSNSTIVFTNTRSQCEFWYQMLLEAHPDFAGQMALHHSSIDTPIRKWIEDALSAGKLKAVISTSSLDLGVDFKPVDTVIQIGSCKGVARFMQRAGRSGHSPFEISRVYFVPTHSLELIEAAAFKEAIKREIIEAREPLVLCYDVLVQFLVTLALGGGFVEQKAYTLVKSTYSFQWMSKDDWEWCIAFVTMGGKIGKNYEEFHKVVKQTDGLFVVEKRRIAMLHRMNIGVIVSDAMVKVKFLSGGYVGMVEEYFISKLKEGDKFHLAGRVLQFIRLKEMTAYVKSSEGKGITPSWLGGRLPLSANLGRLLREKLGESKNPRKNDRDLNFLFPLVDRQSENSHIPSVEEFLVENIKTREGYHLFMYPFEGRLVHEVMASLMAYRISLLYPISFSMAMNDYGFELFSDSEITLTQEQLVHILRKENLVEDVLASINATEMAKRKFRDIAVIGGYVIQNVYGKQKNNRSLQASSGIIFQVLEEHEPNNLLLRQAYTEVFNHQMEEPRLRDAFERINSSKIIYKFATNFTPLSFPIKVDSLRQSLSSEDLSVRIKRMQERNSKLKKRDNEHH
ncbi:ligase-associated DNA damage response DEXH box helicase [Sphingobacterium shayense]|uniref:ligase-associated DNA damage response DEXH box helicase n=1 Tax=Sphingobacterium shayense TaxID=626343 RepID=UPI0031B5D0B4